MFSIISITQPQCKLLQHNNDRNKGKKNDHDNNNNNNNPNAHIAQKSHSVFKCTLHFM